MLKRKLAGIAVILFLGMTATAQSLSIQFDGSVFKVAGWKAPSAAPAKGWASVFVVYAGAGDVPALLGTYSVEGGTLVFHPSFPIAPGVHYRAVFQPPDGSAAIEKDFDGPPRDKTPVARVEHVYPSGDVWPSNQLRLYIYFSAPMSRGEAGARIHVLDENGKSPARRVSSRRGALGPWFQAADDDVRSRTHQARTDFQRQRWVRPSPMASATRW